MKLTQIIKKADVLLLMFLVAAGLSSLLLVRSGGTGESVVISVNGQQYGVYPLTVDRVIEVGTEYGYNQVTIEGGRVCVSDSDCSNHDCQTFGYIQTANQSIICLPHRLIVTVTGESDIDVVVY